MRLELRHLRVVCAIADAGSVTKAAASLGLAAPALTTQLQRIERTLGGQLFVRDRRGAHPTPLGELVLARARVLLPAMQGLQDEAAQFAGATGALPADGLGSYRIGAVNGPLIGGMVRRLAAAQPHAQLHTHPSWSAAELAGMLGDGRLDFALIGTCGEAQPPDSRLAWHTVAVAPVFVLLPDEHPYAEAAEVELATLAGARWAATPGDGCLADCFAAACTRAGFTPSPIHENDVGGVTDLVRGGDVVALCQPTFREVVGVRAVPLAGTPLRWRHLIGWHPEAPAAEVAPKLIQYATESYDDAIHLSPRYQAWLTRHP
ncbi:LysR family transcriptional regulator [Catellatospora tritici]|uniref:LysR substrate-binding domain-containing protein n=1 Tax=Catellatospora tritici TaxID=2851566 RepID=UPI001C2CF741|nr:LysR family transcriptional regulator [Catellatospora tritici]MBV1851672.1 LysR family transcriptional regulator [Catellatospora tritici]